MLSQTPAIDAKETSNGVGGGTKECSVCLMVKPRSKFHKRNTSRDGLTSECADCINRSRKAITRALGKANKCEYCGDWTRCKEMCTKCFREAVKHFGAMKPEPAEDRHYQRWLAECAYKSATTVEARMRLKRELAAMDKADVELPNLKPKPKDFNRMVRERFECDPWDEGERYHQYRMSPRQAKFGRSMAEHNLRYE